MNTSILTPPTLSRGTSRFALPLRVPVVAAPMLPLMGPALATTAIFTFIWTWSDFFTPLIYLTDPATYTVPVALRSFLDSTSGSNWGQMFAMPTETILSYVPVSSR